MDKLGWSEIETNAVSFSRRWKKCNGDERQEANTFEKDFVNAFGVDWHNGLHEYEVRDIEGRTKFIDYLLPGKILIEMKSKGESLIRAYNQGYEYVKCLTNEERPELLVVSDFDYIQVTNLNTMQTFNRFKISTLKDHVRMFGILSGYDSEVSFKTDIEVNIDASYMMAKLHDRLKVSGYIGKSLERYLVRILFCLFAEDTGIFEEKIFENYIKDSKADGSDLSARMMLLFDTLNTEETKRIKMLPDELKKFRYIDGGVFADCLPPAYFDAKMLQTIIDCCEFDWSFISPAIFGAMFQGVMDEKQRREMGAHYTSEDNIMKLIKPLFLDKLWDEFERKKHIKNDLIDFYEKISKLKFLDPACGCGNFLVITYRELRLLEFEILKMLFDNKQITLVDIICNISVKQFYGIEYEEFPCQIAQVGIILMKHQMDKEVSNYFGFNLIDFPIKENANITHGNSLRIDWNDIVSNKELSYIIGNPPFIGARNMKTEQKSDMQIVFGGFKGIGNLDYVTAWYKKAVDYIQGTEIKTAFVSTNSISQGEQVTLLWKPFFEKYNISIDFAYRTFKWSNEARGNAAVHCVIIGFSLNSSSNKKIIFNEDGTATLANNINPYLIEGNNTFIISRSKPICDVPEMSFGSMPNDGGYLIFNDDEKNNLVESNPKSEIFFRQFVGADNFINNKKRWCLWLLDADPAELKKIPAIIDRVIKVRDCRNSSPREATRKLALSPSLFGEIRQPNSNYLIIPCHSSEKRRYVPIGFVDNNIIASNAVQIIPNATLYHFGVLTSSVHMAWMRAVCGRIKSDYRYSKDIVYNNFPWPNPTDKQKETIEKMAQEVLNVREKYKDCTLADLYNPVLMKIDLIKAHDNLDREVGKAYGTIWKPEGACTSDLMKLYQKRINEINTKTEASKRKRDFISI